MGLPWENPPPVGIWLFPWDFLLNNISWEISPVLNNFYLSENIPYYH